MRLWICWYFLDYQVDIVVYRNFVKPEVLKNGFSLLRKFKSNWVAKLKEKEKTIVSSCELI